MGREITREELNQILEKHELWLRSGGKEGERADLKGANLTGVDLIGVNLSRASLVGVSFIGARLGLINLAGANLRDARLRDANLYGANLYGANLWRADFTGANLEGANFANTIVNGTTGINIPGRNTTYLETSIRGKEQEIDQLKKQLDQAGDNAEQTKELKNQIEQVQEQKQKQENELKILKEQIDDLKIELSGKIGEAKKSLENSLKNASEQIQYNSKYAKYFGWGGLAIFGLSFIGLVFIPIYIWCKNVFPSDNWHILFYTFPMIAMILIATTLLRHQKALLNEVRYFSAMKHQVELYSGLLEASQHAAAGLGNPEKSAEYVQETFTQIRDRLLSIQHFRYQTDAQSEDKRSHDDSSLDRVARLLEKITDLAGKGS